MWRHTTVAATPRSRCLAHPLAPTFNLTSAGLLSASTALPGAVAMAGAFAGMFIGQAVRSRMRPEAFRRWFLVAMIFLGIYLVGSALTKIW